MRPNRHIDVLFHVFFQGTPVPNEDKEKAMKGQEYKFIEDFGEQLVSKHQTVIVIFDLETGDIKVLPRKSNTSTGML